MSYRASSTMARTVLLTTQQLEEADYLADHIVVIERGKVVARNDRPRVEEPGWWRAGSPSPSSRQPTCLPREILEHVKQQSPTVTMETLQLAAPAPGAGEILTAVLNELARRRFRSTTSACDGRRWTRCSSSSPANLGIDNRSRSSIRKGERLDGNPLACDPGRINFVSARLVTSCTRDSLLITQTNVKHFLAQRVEMTATAMPIILHHPLRVRVWECDPSPGVKNYREYLMPGIFARSATSPMVAAAVGMAEMKEKGQMDRFRSLPMARSAVLVDQGRRSTGVVALIGADRDGRVVGDRLATTQVFRRRSVASESCCSSWSP